MPLLVPPSPPRVCGVPSLLDSWFVWESLVRVSNAGSPHGHDHATYSLQDAYISRPMPFIASARSPGCEAGREAPGPPPPRGSWVVPDYAMT